MTKKISQHRVEKEKAYSTNHIYLVIVDQRKKTAKKDGEKKNSPKFIPVARIAVGDAGRAPA